MFHEDMSSISIWFLNRRYDLLFLSKITPAFFRLTFLLLRLESDLWEKSGLVSLAQSLQRRHGNYLENCSR